MSERQSIPPDAQAELEELRAQVERLKDAEAERDWAQQALYTSETRMHRLLESLPIVLYSAEAGTNRVYLMAGAVKRVLGYEPEQYMSDPDFGSRQIHPDDGNRVYHAFMDGLNSGEPFDVEFRIVHGDDGHPRWIRQHVLPVVDPDGKLIRQDNVLIDVTEQLRTEQSLRDSEERIRAILDAIPDMMFRYTRGGIALDFRPGVDSQPFVPPEEFLGKPLQGILPAEVAQQAMEGIERACSEKQLVLVEYQLPFEDTQRDYEARIVPCCEDEVLILVRDISESKRAQHALKEERNLLRTMIDALPSAIYVKDTEGRFLLANQATATFLGASTPEDLTGRSDADFFRPELAERYRQEERRVIHEGTPIINRERRFLHDDGTPGWASVTKVPLRDTEGNTIGLVGASQDISKRKRAESRLELLSKAVEQSSEGIAFVDEAERVVFVNKAFAEMHGYDPEELLGKHLSIFHAPEQMAIVDEANKQIRDEGIFYGEVPHVRSDGKAFPSMMCNSRVFDDDGQPIGIIGTMRDITAQKEAQEQLRHERDFNRNMVEASPAFIVSLKPDGSTLLMSGAMLKALGYSREEVVGKDYLTHFIPEAERPALRRLLEQLAAGEGPTIGTNHVLKRDGGMLLVEWQGRQVLNADGDLDYFFGVGIDITERTKAEDALRESEELHRSLIETSPDGIVLIDLEGKIIKANQRAAELYGMASIDELAGIDGISLMIPDEREEAVENLKRVLEKGTLRNLPCTLIRKDRSTFSGEASISVVYDRVGEPRGFICVVRDVTERNRLQHQVLQTQKLESIGTLAGGVAHDFNNLLAVIIGNVSVLLRHKNMPAASQDLLRDIMEAADRASSLTRQLLAYARGGLQKPSPTELPDRIEAVLRILRRTSPRGIELRVDVAPDLPTIMGDPSQIEQVIMNLCLNSLESSEPPSRIDIAATHERIGNDLAHKLEIETGDYVRMEIRDEGCGMDPETVQRIFEPFFSTKPMGRGMGLSATEGIIRSHQGQIAVDSEPGRGTTVIVWLPVANVETPPRAGGATVARDTLRAGNETILIIDHDAAQTRLLENALSSMGFIAVAHTDVREALALLETNAEEVDLVLVNANMEGWPAAKLMGAIRECAPATPVLLSLDRTPTGTPPDASLLGAAECVTKPFSVTDLARTIRRVLE